MFKKFIMSVGILGLMGSAHLQASHLDAPMDPEAIAKTQAFDKCIRFENFNAQYKSIAPIFGIPMECDTPILEALFHGWPAPTSAEAESFLRQIKAYQDENQGAHYPLPLPDDINHSLNVLASRYFNQYGSCVQLLTIRDKNISKLPRLIGELNTLKKLRLINTKVSDLSPLQNLLSLQELYLNDTQVSDLSPLQNLQALKVLWLENTQVSDLSPLQNLQALEELSLENTPVTSQEKLEATQALFGANVRIYLENGNTVNGTRP